MVKAFIVDFKNNGLNNLYSVSGFGYSSQISYPTKKEDTRPILVIANNIADVASKYPNATSIDEEDVKDVVILEKVICPVIK